MKSLKACAPATFSLRIFVGVDPDHVINIQQGGIFFDQDRQLQIGFLGQVGSAVGQGVTFLLRGNL